MGWYMELQRREQVRVSKPLAPPIDLDAGAIDLRQAVLAVLFGLGLLVVALGGALVVSLSARGSDWSWLGIIAGALVSLVGVGLGGTVFRVLLLQWHDHRARVVAWNTAALGSYIEQRGAVIAEEITEYSFTVSNPLHVMVIALEVHRRVVAGEEFAHATRSLRGPVFMGGVRVGELSKTRAEEMAQRLAALGLIVGRCEGYAGRWSPVSYDDVIVRLTSAQRG